MSVHTKFGMPAVNLFRDLESPPEHPIGGTSNAVYTFAFQWCSGVFLMTFLRVFHPRNLLWNACCESA
jgi:hypothetical protein